MNEAALLELIRAQLADGRLPIDRVIRFQARYGDGTPCAVCDLAMQSDDIAYELCFGEREHLEARSMHYRCFCIWERERRPPHAA